MFILGGSSGLILGNSVVDISSHDTYYIVSHFHVVLSLGTVILILIGISYYLDYLLYVSLSTVLSYVQYQAFIIGILLTFISLHFLSYNSQPRRISDFPDS